MRIDVVDCRKVCDAGVLERGLYSLDCAVAGRIGCRYVVGVGRSSVAGQLAVDPGAACLGVRLALENQHRRAFTHDKAVAVLVEGTRSS